MSFTANNSPPIGHNSGDPEIEKIVQALERDGFEAQKPKAVPHDELLKLARRAMKSDEARDDLADAVQGEIYSAMTGAIDVPSGSGLAGATWLREAMGPTMLIALARYAQTGGDVTGALVAWIVLRCVDAAVSGNGAELRASDAEIAAALGVRGEQVRRARQRIQQDSNTPFLTIETAERSKPRYVLASVAAMAFAEFPHIKGVIDRLGSEGHLRSPEREPRAWGSTQSSRPSAARYAADLDPEPVENAQSAARYAADAAARYAADGNAPATNNANLRRGTPQMSQSAARYAADAGSLKGDQKSRARPASCSNVSGNRPIGTEEHQEEHAARATAGAVDREQEEVLKDDHPASRARKGAPARAQEATTPSNAAREGSTAIALQAAPVIEGEVLASGVLKRVAEEGENPASIIGVIERARDFAWVCPKTGKPQKITYRYIEQTIGAGVADTAAVRAWAKEEIATAIERGMDGDLVGWLRKGFGTGFRAFVQRQAQIAQAADLVAPAAPPREPNYLPAGHYDRKLALPPALKLFGDGRDGRPLWPDYKIAGKDDANRALRHAWALNGGKFDIDTTDFNNVSPEFVDRRDGWHERLGAAVLEAAARRALRPAPDGLAAELAALAPGVPDDVIAGLIEEAYKDPVAVGIALADYDPEGTPALIANRLRGKALELRHAYEQAVLRLCILELIDPKEAAGRRDLHAGAWGWEKVLAAARVPERITVPDPDGPDDANVIAIAFAQRHIAEAILRVEPRTPEDLLQVARIAMADVLRWAGCDVGLAHAWAPEFPEARIGLRSLFGAPAPRRQRQLPGPA